MLLSLNIFTWLPWFYEFRISLIIFSFKVNVGTWLNIDRFHFDCFMIRVVKFVNYLIYFIDVHILWYCVHMLINFILQRYGKSFCNNRSSFIVCWINVNIVILQPLFYWSIVKVTVLNYPYFVWFTTRLI